jgi:hypothetical protein
MALPRLTRERYARMRAAGTFVGGAEPAIAVAPEPAPLVRGGRSVHPQWFQVLALVGPDVEFVTEAPTLGQAMTLATRYPFRAFVVDRHSKRQFDNGKPIEVMR